MDIQERLARIRNLKNQSEIYKKKYPDGEADEFIKLWNDRCFEIADKCGL